MDGKWIEVKIITKSEDIQCFTGVLYDLGITQIAIEDPEDFLDTVPGPLTWDFGDLNILEYGDKAATLKFYIEEDADAIISNIKKEIENLNAIEAINRNYRIEKNNIFEEDWANTWKKYYKPTKVGRNIIIKPLWENYNVKENEIIIDMDPGMAFGTGTHETTRMCIEALEKYIHKDSLIYDIGTGSGILAIAASKLGGGKIMGIDIDPIAVASAEANVKNNNVSNVEIQLGDLLTVVSNRGSIVVANIIADAIISMLKDVREVLIPKGIFISSGIIKDRLEDVMNSIVLSGFNILECNSLGEWACIIAEKKGE